MCAFRFIPEHVLRRKQDACSRAVIVTSRSHPRLVLPISLTGVKLCVMHAQLHHCVVSVFLRPGHGTEREKPTCEHRIASEFSLACNKLWEHMTSNNTSIMWSPRNKRTNYASLLGVVPAPGETSTIQCIAENSLSLRAFLLGNTRP